MLSDRKHMSKPNRRKRELIKKISQHTDIRADVVAIILDGFIDVVIEEIVNEGDFGLRQLFEVSSAEWGSYSINSKHKVAKHTRLKISLSYAVRELWKARFSEFNGEKGHITKDNWRDILRSRRKPVSSGKNSAKINDDDYNPFIDDDD